MTPPFISRPLSKDGSDEDGAMGPGTGWSVRPASGVNNLPWAHLRLPPFPQVAVRVMRLAADENVQLPKLSELISSDPAFASEVLTVANSVLYAPRYPANSIQQAIQVLGATTLQGVCITVGVRAYMGKAMSHPAMRRVWHHNLACAIIAQRLAAGGAIDKDLAYTCGILHDIGRIALAVIQPREYANLLETHQGTPTSILKSENDMFGQDHCETGQLLIADWKLPDAIDASVFNHHWSRRPDRAWGLGELVKVSCKMADAAGFPAFEGCETAPYQELLDELPPRERGLFYPELERLSVEVAAGIHAVESV